MPPEAEYIVRSLSSLGQNHKGSKNPQKTEASRFNSRFALKQ